MNVAVLGASKKPDRYSYKAIQFLREKGHTPIPVHPVIKDVEGIPVHPSLADVPEEVDTVTVYLSATNSNKYADEILSSGTKRVIFNPGAENPELAGRLKDAGIEVVEACTLVMLRTDQF